jgi:hypothetical protein
MPENHIKPTKEELEQQAQQAIEEAEKLAKETPKEEETPEEPVIEAPMEEKPEEPVVETPPEEQAEPSEEVKEQLKKEVEEKDKKLSASARENQKIYAKNRVINKALVEADEIPDPTDEELVKEFPDWDLMSDVEKSLAKETVISRNWRKKISEAKEQATKIEKWNESVETYAEDPKTLVDNPELEGKTEEFKEFALQESNNSVPFKILVSAFLHDQSKDKKSNKGRMFENGSGGPNEKPTPKTDKITLEEARRLRENDYGKYRELLRAGKIELGDL